ncbi:MAG: hypothetical protein K2P92_05835, partial [Bdellovibrionaceae bacterium]|nr:hypothetical protein [Pseudobdellovibrionaceae bacterium]
MMLGVSRADAARIRNRKVKEAPKICGLMQEDVHLTRGGKKVYGTLRHSLVFENDEQMNNISLVKDKGEKICQWQSTVWNQILKNNQVENQMGFKYYLDEYKEILYTYVQKADKSYFIMTTPFATCSLEQQVTRADLDLPKCEIPK